MNFTNLGTRKRKLRTSSLVAGSVLALLLAACGSNSTASPSTTTTSSASTAVTAGSSKAVATASAELAKYTGTAAPVAPGPAFDASKAAGKMVWIVEQLAANPAVAVVTQNYEVAMTHENVKFLTCDAHGASVAIATCIEQGLPQHPMLILIVGGEPSTYASGTAAAEAAHVPVISALGLPPLSSIDTSVVAPELARIQASAPGPYLLAGTLAADYIVSHSKGNAHVLFIGSPGLIDSTFEQKTFVQTLNQLCPSCTLDTQQVIITNWASDLGPTVSAQLQLHPEINYVVPVFDPMAAYTDPAIAQAGKSSTIKVVTVNGSLQQMTNLSQGQMITADIGLDLPEVGFQAADETLRLVTGQTSSNSNKQTSAGLRVFSSANVGSLTLTAAAWGSSEWFTGSPAALQDLYYKLWSGK